VIGLLMLHQVPTLRDLAGIGLVIAGVAVHREPPPGQAAAVAPGQAGRPASHNMTRCGRT
jgi:inner membrane transporter RhtA